MQIALYANCFSCKTPTLWGAYFKVNVGCDMSVVILSNILQNNINNLIFEYTCGVMQITVSYYHKVVISCLKTIIIGFYKYFKNNTNMFNS